MVIKKLNLEQNENGKIKQNIFKTKSRSRPSMSDMINPLYCKYMGRTH